MGSLSFNRNARLVMELPQSSMNGNLNIWPLALTVAISTPSGFVCICGCILPNYDVVTAGSASGGHPEPDGCLETNQWVGGNNLGVVEAIEAQGLACRAV